MKIINIRKRIFTLLQNIFQFKYLLYFLVSLLFLMAMMYVCLVMLDSYPKDMDIISTLDSGFVLPDDFFFHFDYGFMLMFDNQIELVRYGGEVILGIMVSYTFFYLLYKSLSERILPPRRPYLRDILEILLFVSLFEIHTIIYIVDNHSWLILPVFLIIYTYYVCYLAIIAIIRRMIIKSEAEI